MEEENKTDVGQPTNEIAQDTPTADTTAPQSAVPTESQKGGSTVWIVGLLILGALGIAAIAYYVTMDSSDGDMTTEVRDADSVVAMVNGEAIYQKDVDARVTEASQELLAQGVDMTNPSVRAGIESQILEDIISYKLLVQASAEEDIVVSDAEVDALLEGYITQSGGEEALDAELAKIDLTRDSFRERIVEQLTLQQYISDNIQQTEVTDEDIAAFYESVVAGQEGAPALDVVSEQIAAQLSADAQQQQVEAFVASLRAEAEVEVN